MKKQILAIVLAITLGAEAGFSEILNIVHQSPNAAIYLDGQLVGKGSAYNLEIKVGSHHVKVIDADVEVYQKIIDIPPGITTTIDTGRFVGLDESTYGIGSQIPNKGAQQIETHRLKESKGDIGVGFVASGFFGGVSIKKYFNDFGIQLVGWESDEKDSCSSLFEGRILFNVRHKLVYPDFLTNLYLGFGVGTKYSKDNSDTSHEPFQEYFIGTEFPMWNLFFGHLEISYLVVENEKNTIKTEKEMKINSGIHFYF